MIELGERLSEFSYGYGVTREVEKLLADVGVEVVPFLPSLLDEKRKGFDAGFKRPGVPLLLQFKLGQSLTRFVRRNISDRKPELARPFFRFRIDTSEPDGQFETLLAAEKKGAEVYYVAPRFADWTHYAEAYETGRIMTYSVLVSPRTIEQGLLRKNAIPGIHRIVYDEQRVHVCSTPEQIEEVRPEKAIQSVLQAVRGRSESLATTVRRVYDGLDERISSTPEGTEFLERDIVGLEDARAFDYSDRVSAERSRWERRRRLESIRSRSQSEAETYALALGYEVWGLGIQLIFAMEKN